MKCEAFFEKIFYPLIFLTLSFFLFTNCGRRPDPRGTVIKFVKAVAKSDSLSLQKLVDFDMLAQKKFPYLPEEKLDQAKNQLKRNFLKDGTIRVKWENYRKVVGDTRFEGDTATVELTFMHLKTGIYRYTNVRLYLKDGRWKIFYYED